MPSILRWKTVRAGERAAVWSKNGNCKIVDGPKRVYLFNKTMTECANYFASEMEYLECRQKAGPVEIIQGPCSLFKDPVLHESVMVKRATMVDASEALVVYRHNDHEPHDKLANIKEEATSSTTADAVRTHRLVSTELKGGGSGASGGVERRIVRGPARFIPASNEWVHEFAWSGVPKDGSKTTYQPKALKFSSLKTIPMTAYHNVVDTRTNDDTLLTVKLMIFFELVDIEKMLDSTADPIGDFINAASSDVIAFCAGVSYETFLNETAKLNELTSFGQLTSRADQIGYRITKVVFRGFHAGDMLQKMHDGAIQERTRLRLQEETQVQEQRTIDMTLDANKRRQTKEAELDAERTRQQMEISLMKDKAQFEKDKLKLEARLEEANLKSEQEMAQMRERHQAEVAHEQSKIELEKARNEEQLRMMREMKGLGVDLTQVLISQQENPSSVIKLATDNKGGGGAAAAAPKNILGALQLNLS